MTCHLGCYVSQQSTDFSVTKLKSLLTQAYRMQLSRQTDKYKLSRLCDHDKQLGDFVEWEEPRQHGQLLLPLSDKEGNTESTSTLTPRARWVQKCDSSLQYHDSSRGLASTEAHIDLKFSRLKQSFSDILSRKLENPETNNLPLFKAESNLIDTYKQIELQT